MLIKRKFEFEMAHCLDEHDRGCNNIHGHSYKLIVGIEANPNEIIKSGSSGGMIIDFHNLNRIVNEEIINKLDHKFAYNENNQKETKIADYISNYDKRVVSFSHRTTCELMALDILKKLKLTDQRFNYVELFETSNSSVIVTGKDLSNDL